MRLSVVVIGLSLCGNADAEQAKYSFSLGATKSDIEESSVAPTLGAEWQFDAQLFLAARLQVHDDIQEQINDVWIEDSFKSMSLYTGLKKHVGDNFSFAPLVGFSTAISADDNGVMASGDTGFSYGFVADWSLTENVSVYAELLSVLKQGEIDSYTTAGMGLTYRFGNTQTAFQSRPAPVAASTTMSSEEIAIVEKTPISVEPAQMAPLETEDNLVAAQDKINTADNATTTEIAEASNEETSKQMAVATENAMCHLQLGFFSNESNALALQSKLVPEVNTAIVASESPIGFRVLVLPGYQTKMDANQDKRRISELSNIQPALRCQ